MPSIKKKKPLPEIKGKTLPELAKEMKAWTSKKQKFEEAFEEAKSVIHKIATQLMPPLLEDIEGDGVNLPGIGFVEVGIELYPYVKKEDLEDFFVWLRKQHEGDIIKETIHPKTLQAWVANWIDDPERAGKLPDVLTVAKVPTAKLLKERTKKRR